MEGLKIVAVMNEEQIKVELVDLVKLISPDSSVDMDISLEELFTLMRAGVKYTLLDLDATRRELDAAKEEK